MVFLLRRALLIIQSGQQHVSMRTTLVFKIATENRSVHPSRFFGGQNDNFSMQFTSWPNLR